jgi:hypothetical protein
MKLGLTYEDIVNSFSGALVSDFGVGTVAGSAIINNEIDFQFNNLTSYLTSEVLQLLDRVNGEVALVDANDKFSPSLYADSDLRGYIVYKGYSPCPNQDIESLDMCWENLQQYPQTVTTANISGLGDNQYQILDAFDYKTQNLVIYYSVDQDNLVLESLKSCLRAKVCYSLGSRLYPVGSSDSWSVVKYYGEEANKYLDYLIEGNMSADFKKIRLINKKTGLSSIRVVRS